MASIGITRNEAANGRISFTADINIKGYPRLKKTWDTEEQAAQWRRDELRDMKSKKAGLYVAPKGSLGDLIKQYVLHYGNLKGGWSRSKQNNLDKLSDDIGGVMLADCTMQTFIDYAHKCRAGGRGASGTQERFAYLAKVFKVGFMRWGIATPRDELARAIFNLKEEGVVANSTERTRRIEQFEIAQIKEYLSPVMQRVVDTLMVLPFRVGEMCAIKWKEVDEVNRAVLLHRKNTKKNKTEYHKSEWVYCPVVETIKDGKVVEIDTFDLIMQGGRGAPEDYVFGIKGADATRMFWWAHKTAGIEDIHLHDCRAHAITNLLAAGHDPLFVTEISGHTNMVIFKRHYVRMVPRQLKEIFAKRVKANQARRSA